MFIYHSKNDPSGVRVTVVGRFDEVEGQLLTAVARCSHKDIFRKKDKIIPAKEGSTVQTKNGPKRIPPRAEQVLKGGINIAAERLDGQQYFRVFNMNSCSGQDFVTIARGIAQQAVNKPELVEKSKNF